MNGVAPWSGGVCVTTAMPGACSSWCGVFEHFVVALTVAWLLTSLLLLRICWQGGLLLQALLWACTVTAAVGLGIDAAYELGWVDAVLWSDVRRVMFRCNFLAAELIMLWWLIRKRERALPPVAGKGDA